MIIIVVSSLKAGGVAKQNVLQKNLFKPNSWDIVAIECWAREQFSRLVSSGFTKPVVVLQDLMLVKWLFIAGFSYSLLLVLLFIISGFLDNPPPWGVQQARNKSFTGIWVTLMFRELLKAVWPDLMETRTQT